MRLKEIAHIRTGDKGNNCNICVIPYREKDFTYLQGVLTEETVRDFFHEICHGTVTRYTLPEIFAFNFVLTKSLGGGVIRSLNIDRHGKSLGMALAEIELPSPDLSSGH